MKKIIKIVNDTLRDVITSIESYHNDNKKELVAIEERVSEITEKTNELRNDIQDYSDKIAIGEKNIKDLENDLDELNNKFSKRNLTEMVAVGNREINTKIVENKEQVTKDQTKINSLLDEAKELKVIIAELNSKKEAAISNLSKCEILEKYYRKQLNSIIEFTENHTEEIAARVIEDTGKLDVAYIDENKLNSEIDDRIFTEIENMSISSIDENELLDALNTTYEEDEDGNKVPTISLDEQVDGLIKELNAINDKSDLVIKKSNQVQDQYKLKNFEVIKSKPKEEKEEKEEPIEVKIEKETDKTEKEKLIQEESVEVEENVEEVEEEAFPPKFEFIDDANATEDSNKEVNEPIEESKVEENDLAQIFNNVNTTFIPNIDFEEQKDDSTLEAKDDNNLGFNPEDIFKEIEKEAEAEERNSTEEIKETNNELTNEETSDEENIFKQIGEMAREQEETEENEKQDEFVIDFNQNEFMDDFEKLDLEVDEFAPNDFAKFKEHFNYNNIKKHLDVLMKHNINRNKIYHNVDLFINITPQNLDQILTLLEGKTTTGNIDIIFNKLDKVNMNKLETAIELPNNESLAEIIYSSITDNKEETISSLLELNKDETKTLKSSCKGNQYRIMNVVPEIVVANYNTLKSYKIDNLNTCITKYPERFIMDPDKFSAILDRYDPEDLVRCINKNAAVISKL